MEAHKTALAQYVYEYTIALLPNVRGEDFESHMIHEVLPKFVVLRRNIAGMDLDHHLLKRRTSRRLDRYVWQIRVLSVKMVSSPDSMGLNAMDGEVRDKLSGFAQSISLRILSEIGAARTG